ncbi:uncharacterized protein TNCV_4052691 [Trichonephila clavipes]|nr:uncharacterized protein TNCV_4052691 [Trichonephila clavipes]
MTTTCNRVRVAVGVRHLFSVMALLCCPVASWCTRNDDNDIAPRTLSGGSWSFFFRRDTTLLPGPVLVQVARWQRYPTGATRRLVFVPFYWSRHYSAVRSHLGARGTMTTTSYRVRAAVGVRHLFSGVALLCCPVASWCTRNDDNDILPRPPGGGCSSPFFR